MSKATSTTPDPELFYPKKPGTELGGDNPRGETTACPTGLSEMEDQPAVPHTGAVDPSVPHSPGEGIPEDQSEHEADAISGHLEVEPLEGRQGSDEEGE